MLQENVSFQLVVLLSVKTIKAFTTNFWFVLSAYSLSMKNEAINMCYEKNKIL